MKNTNDEILVCSDLKKYHIIPNLKQTITVKTTGKHIFTAV